MSASKTVCAAFLAAAAILASIQANAASAQFSTIRRALKHHHQVGHIRVFYGTEGSRKTGRIDNQRSKKANHQHASH